jgi:hypothetical protein
MKEGVDITKIVGSKTLLMPSQVDTVLEYLKTNGKVDFDMKKVEGCTNAFISNLIYKYNKSVKFDRSNKLIFFNVKNPVVVLKIQEAQFNFFDKVGAKKYIKMHDKILKDVLKNY